MENYWKRGISDASIHGAAAVLFWRILARGEDDACATHVVTLHSGFCTLFFFQFHQWDIHAKVHSHTKCATKHATIKMYKKIWYFIRMHCVFPMTWFPGPNPNGDGNGDGINNGDDDGDGDNNNTNWHSTMLRFSCTNITYSPQRTNVQSEQMKDRHTNTHRVRAENVRTDLHIRSSISVSAMQWCRDALTHTYYYTHTNADNSSLLFFLFISVECILEWLGFLN